MRYLGCDLGTARATAKAWPQWRVRQRERASLNAVDVLVCVSDRDVNTLRAELGITTPSVSIATIRAKEKLSYECGSVTDDRILFFGSMVSAMNKDAAVYAATELLPAIRRRCLNAELVIAGSYAEANISQLAKHEHVTVVGDLSSAELIDLLHHVKLALLPLRIGSGLKGRVLEAMEAGTPIVGTTIAAEGIPAIHGQHMIIADDPGEIVDWVCRILVDTSLRRTLSHNARLLVESTYNWENTYGKIHDVLTMACENFNHKSACQARI